MPLHRADRGFGVQNQAGDLLTAAFVVGGLVAGQPAAARAVAVLDVDGTADGGSVGDPLAALRACPGQRRVTALAAGELFNRVLSGGEQQVRTGLAGNPVDHALQVLVGLDAAGGGDVLPPAAGGSGGLGQLDQGLIGQPGLPLEAGGKLGERLVHVRHPKLTYRDHAGTSGNPEGGGSRPT